MIGQEKLKEKLNKYKILPKFIIFEGILGSGKKSLFLELAKKYKLNPIILSTQIEDINFILDTNKNTKNNLFYIDKGETINILTQNKLLKITEEIENNYIILGVNDRNKLLDTILSRAIIFKFGRYYNSDYEIYLKDKYDENTNYYSLYPNLYYVNKYNLKEINKLNENIERLLNENVKLKEALKIYNFIKIYEDDLLIFLLENNVKKIFMNEISKIDVNFKDITKYATYITLINNLGTLLKTNNLYNRNYIYETFLINLKEGMLCQLMN